ncbi:hypothetical protein H310_05747 [Aphanomyces invadans]|uniref:Apple domain-containing protein n=1 Tax=Aphanomyces invadans TaxID=157072 RepID=A0A024U7C9_9STRA|nr:hypothetical protein H310_05747 [Aphanomyces invadans]ETW02179.1 hypothetical protein H310_05747 [Aphanomyces invadans]|eukprot:XP_008868784.1 hypothetical protein H310_05747 [Aphanomyces invadans]
MFPVLRVCMLIFNSPCSAIEDNEDNVDYRGNDLGNTRQASAEGCCQDCTNKPGCQVFTWTNYENLLASPGAKSGLIQAPPTPGPRRTSDHRVDIPNSCADHNDRRADNDDECTQDHDCRTYHNNSIVPHSRAMRAFD